MGTETQVTCCQILSVPVKRAQLEFSLRGNSVLPWTGKLQLKDPMPVFFSVGSKPEDSNGGCRFQTTVPQRH